MSLPSAAYQDIIDWARSQLDSETLHSKAAPITAAQRKALLDLLQLVKPVPAHSEPEVGDTNWVGLLHRFRDAHPDAAGVSFTEEPVDVQSSQPRWTYYVAIAENEQPFPGPAHGLVEVTGEAPSFARKKDAKQYAAKCAVEWLRASKLMPGSGDGVKFRKGVVSPPPKRQKMGSMPPPPASASNDAAAASPPAASTRTRTETRDPGDEAKPSYASQVAALCNRLGFQAPSYKLEQVKNGYWSGHPEFVDIEQQRFPVNMGHVTNILGKNPAKERIAEEVLMELQKVMEERENSMRNILESLRPGTGTG